MGASFIRLLRNSSAGAWVVLALTVFLPLFAFLFAFLFVPDFNQDFTQDCTPGLLFRGSIGIPCSILRIASFAVSAAGAFVVIVLLWWLLTELIGLRRIFEVPWFGVGDDVENVGVVESIVRAGLFVVFVWIALGLSGLAFIGMSGTKFDKTGGNNSPDAKSRSSLELAPLLAAADKLAGEVKGIRDQLAGRPQPAGTDPAIVPRLQRLGDDLRDIQAVLKNQDSKLDALRQIDGPVTRPEQDRNGAAILDEAKRLNGALGEVRTLLDAQGRKLDALSQIDSRLTRWEQDRKDVAILDEAKRMNGTLGEARTLLDAQGRKLDALQQIDGRLTRWEQDRKDAAILDEAKRLNGTLGETRNLLDAQGRKLAAMDDFERWLRDLDVKQAPAIAGGIGEMTGVVTEVRRLARAHGEALARVQGLLEQRSPEEPPATPPNTPLPPDETSCLDRGVLARAVSAPAAPRRYSRTLLVFFDKSGVRLTPRAVETLRELADDLRHVDQPSASIFGSADAQGDPTVSAQYAEQRAQAVKQFLERNVPQLTVRLTSARSADEPASEPYNRVARVEAQGTCR